MNLHIWSCRDAVALERAFADRDELLEAVVVRSDADALVSAASSDGQVCTLLDAVDGRALTVVDRVVAVDPDSIVLVSVPRGDHTMGLDAIRRGAHDYIETSENGSIDVDGVLRRLHAAISRSGRVIRSLREHRRMAKVLEHSAEGYLVVDPTGAVLTTSPSLSRIWPDGFDDLDTIFDALHEADRAAAQQLGVDALSRPGVPAVGEVRAVGRDGVERWFEIRINDQSGDPAIGGLITNVRDITDQKESKVALAHQAMHDALTGLPNRAMLEHRLSSALVEEAQMVTVLFIDVDNFKVVNDGLGHTVGDQILLALANRLGTSIRAEDTAARFGGDEFAVVLRGIPSAEAAIVRAQHLLEVLSSPMCIDNVTHFVSVSIGVARGGSDASAETLLRDADAAMYQAKALGRERVEMFQHSFHARAEHRLRTGTKMRHALEAGHFHVAYQPFIAIDDERVIGMEALLRWDDPESGAISPGEFIPVAEQTGLIVQLGAWALDEALRQLQTWRKERPWGHDLSLSVNLSARQLTADGLVDSVHQSILDTGVDAGALCLEITETAVMEDIESSIGLMRMMRGLGVDISIDDFGTGYSSLNYLKSLPLTTLKVDRSFIDGLGNDPHDTSIVEAVIALGHALGMRVHAEGVERPDQLAELRRLGCDDAQGWLWAPAMGAGDFEAWMATRTT